MKSLLLILLCLGATHTLATEIEWRSDFELSLEEAVLERKPLFVTFYTDWCGWCKRLDQTTFRNPTFVERLRTYYVPVKINGDEQRGLAAMFHIRAYPTTVFLTRSGDEIGRVEGYRKPPDFAQILILGLNHRESGYAALESQVTRNPSDPSLLYAWGDVLLALGRDAEAEQALRKLVDSDLPDAEAIQGDASLDLALAVWRAQGAEESLDLFESYVEDYPHHDRNDYGRLQYALALQEAGHEQESQAMLNSVTRRNPGPYVLRRVRDLVEP